MYSDGSALQHLSRDECLTLMASVPVGRIIYGLFIPNAQAGVPDRDGVTLETPFVGPGMRGCERLMYFPSRLPGPRSTGHRLLRTGR
jgi:hypothetical protein